MKRPYPTTVRPLFLLLFSLLLITPLAHSQEMVKDAGTDGLEKSVSYDVSKFTDIRDKKLEDVMLKMPGLSAMIFNGSISFSYNGMDVDKIYINGLDVLEGNYLPVYNMKPEDVERLDITENHVPIKVMRGKQFSNSVSIDVILKSGTDGKWTGSVKGSVGGTPLLASTDASALNIGSKVQTTVVVKTDNTGLDFSGTLKRFTRPSFGYFRPDNDGFLGLNEVGGDFDFTVNEYLRVPPSLAPLAPDRVRFNKSGITNVGSTIKLSDDYQLNMQAVYHTDRLTASSYDETTYYLYQGSRVEEKTGEEAELKQQDLQAHVTLLSNTDRQFVRNKLSLGIRWSDVDKQIVGFNSNTQQVETNPLFLTNDFHYKKRLGDDILSVSAKAGLYSMPQDLYVLRKRSSIPTEDEFLSQDLTARSYFGDVGAKYDIGFNDQLSLSLKGGASANSREMRTDIDQNKWAKLKEIDSRLNVLNAYTGAKLTYIANRVQAEVNVPVQFGFFHLKDEPLDIDNRKSKFYFSPVLSVKYDVSKYLSVTTEASHQREEVDRRRLYPGILFSDFRRASKGYPHLPSDRSTDLDVSVTYRHPESSFFVNAFAKRGWMKPSFIPIMEFTGDFILSSFREAPDDYHESFSLAMLEMSKGIPSLKGKIGLDVRVEKSESSMVRNGAIIPFTNTEIVLYPYINGRLTSWCNLIYSLDFHTNRLKMVDEGTSSHSKGYTQSLELILSPWKKINFSLLGEHYYTEFMNDVSKHLVLVDFKAEYNLTDRWQLLLTARNILNQDTYNYTLMDPERFTRSYTSYDIRPRNILLGFFYKF